MLLGRPSCRGRKISARLARNFTWPGCIVGLAVDPNAASNRHPKAPLQLLSVLSVPFDTVAVDIVGSMPRTRSGNRYILTAMCLFTHSQ